MAGLGVVWPPPKSKMGVVETTPNSLRGSSTTPVWPAGGFGHPRLAGLWVATPRLAMGVAEAPPPFSFSFSKKFFEKNKNKN
jgi:hypothetical protein